MDLERQRVREAGQQRQHARGIRNMKQAREAQRRQQEAPLPPRQPIVSVVLTRHTEEGDGDRAGSGDIAAGDIAAGEAPRSAAKRAAQAMRSKLLQLERRRHSALAPLCACGYVCLPLRRALVSQYLPLPTWHRSRKPKQCVCVCVCARECMAIHKYTTRSACRRKLPRECILSCKFIAHDPLLHSFASQVHFAAQIKLLFATQMRWRCCCRW